MMTPIRPEFLKSYWKPFPQAPDVSSGVRWQGVHEFSLSVFRPDAAPVQWLCGRVFSIDGMSVWMEGDGFRLPLLLAKDCRWTADSVREECGFHTSQIEVDDLLALQVRVSLEDSENSRPIEVEEIWMLVPTVAIARASEKSLESSAPGFNAVQARQWMKFLATVRHHFVRQDFIEAQTPTLVPSPGTEPHLDPFVSRWEYGNASRNFYLPTSPEFHLKRLLVRGWSRVFEFKTCFRNGEISEHHQPEFQMLEWYRAFDNLDAIAVDVEQLFVALAKEFNLEIPTLRRTTIRELFAKEFGFSLTPQTSREELAELATRESIRVVGDDTWDDIYFRLFLERIEGDLGKDGPLLVRGYPPSQAALSRIGVDGFADRFEIYWQGMELANAFHELNDPQENESRFRQDADLKKQLGKPAVPVDEALIQDLYRGMPPAGGIALGLDRLFMAVMGIKEIAMARAFAVKV